MSRSLGLFALAFLVTSSVMGDDALPKEKAAADKTAEKTPAQKLKEDPNDEDAIIALFNAALQAADELADTKPAEAAKSLESFKEELEALKPDKLDAMI